MSSISIRIQLAPAALEALQRPINGSGGFQNLLRRLQSGLDSNGVLILTPDLAGQVARYVESYGAGGFQGRLETVLGDLVELARVLRPMAA
jgi:hypothetical protein